MCFQPTAQVSSPQLVPARLFPLGQPVPIYGMRKPSHWASHKPSRHLLPLHPFTSAGKRCYCTCNHAIQPFNVLSLHPSHVSSRYCCYGSRGGYAAAAASRSGKVCCICQTQQPQEVSEPSLTAGHTEHVHCTEQIVENIPPCVGRLYGLTSRPP